jgi:hypothetical protein
MRAQIGGPAKKTGDGARIRVVNPQLLADPTAAPESESEPSQSAVPEDSANGPGPAGHGTSSVPEAAVAALEPVTRACADCEAALQEGQDWCLQCGAAAPGSLNGGGPGWRSATTVLAVTAALVLGAAAAAYAALTQPGPRTLAPKVVTVAQAPPTTPVSPATIPTTPTTPVTPGALGTPTTIKPLPSTIKPPKIPLTAPTPKSSGSNAGNGTANLGSGESGTGTGTTKSSTKPSGGTTTEQPSPILLDTNAASTYNPYGYPTSWFGDPSLAIDGETSTAWTAQVNPAVAPKMAEGLAIDLKTAQKVGSIALITSTPGMTVQVYGANGVALPASITDPAWVALSPSLDARKRTTKIKLRAATKAFRFVTLWISQAPQSAVGTPAAPGHVSVIEFELFAAK